MKGGVTTPLEQRPAIRYIERIRETGTASKAASPSQPKKDDSKSGVSGSWSVGTGSK